MAPPFLQDLGSLSAELRSTLQELKAEQAALDKELATMYMLPEAERQQFTKVCERVESNLPVSVLIMCANKVAPAAHGAAVQRQLFVKMLVCVRRWVHVYVMLLTL